MTINADCHQLLGQSVKMGGTSISDPTKIANHLFEALKEVTTLLAEHLAANAEFSVEAHRAQVRQALAAMCHDQMAEEDTFTKQCSSCNCSLRNYLDAAKESSAWLTAMPCKLNSMQLSPQEFLDAFQLHYGKRPFNPEDTCDGCCTPCHARKVAL